MGATKGAAFHRFHTSPKNLTTRRRLYLPHALTVNVPSAKRAGKSAPPPKCRKPLGSHEATQVMSSEDDDDDGDDVVPKQLLLEEKKKNALPCKKLAVLRKEKEKLQERHGRLEDNLLNQLAVFTQNFTLFQPLELNKEPHNEVVELLAEVKGKIHLGNGVFIHTEKWEMLLTRDRDSLFCKEVTRLVWGTAAVRVRSVTGALCRRFLKDGNAIEKPALSPHKLEAVGSRAALYLRCKSSGPIRRDCQVPRCTLCHRYGHEASECA
ncbi:hypothetical protein HPB50_009681 [Hyalomma asiaticum]|uniref:Uncharacterized protein n=1 Tax=Hyalomma asiaticum TaxID=266040 RepID=A0ACB7THA8_HYAAI|nr:hypothetical protein HPB50_009681 [Hyalomma asiaticum]